MPLATAEHARRRCTLTGKFLGRPEGTNPHPDEPFSVLDGKGAVIEANTG
jgi:hypothetical protein